MNIISNISDEEVQIDLSNLDITEKLDYFCIDLYNCSTEEKDKINNCFLKLFDELLETYNINEEKYLLYVFVVNNKYIGYMSDCYLDDYDIFEFKTESGYEKYKECFYRIELNDQDINVLYK